MKRILMLAAAITTVAWGADAERLSQIPVRMKALVDKGSIAGTVTLFAHNGEILSFDAVGYQDIQSRKPMAKDSIFQVMSMTKPMVAVGIVMLAEEGRLALTDPVEKHLPEFRGQLLRVGDVLKKPARPIAIRDLLTHTSGLIGNPPPGLAGLYQRMDKTLEQAVLVYSQQPLQAEPGTEWLYSNAGVATLGRIIEVVSGQPFERFMAERLWQPLGMGDTFLFPPEAKKARICAVHATVDGQLKYADGEKIYGGDALKYRPNAKYPAPEFGAYSTAADLFAFHQMLLEGGSYKGRRYLSRAAIETMTSVHTGDIKSRYFIGTGFGLSWQVVRDADGTLDYLSIGTFGHGGAFGTHGWVDRKRQAVGVFLVQGGAGVNDAKGTFMRMANSALND
jgi:CubicO group peptidase (beta-lactamase class C family)